MLFLMNLGVWMVASYEILDINQALTLRLELVRITAGLVSVLCFDLVFRLRRFYLFYHLHGLGDRTNGDDEQFISPLHVRTSSLLFVLDLADVLMPCLLKAFVSCGC